MPHIDHERLALLALGEQTVGEDARGHLVTCEECLEELDSMRSVVDLGREAGMEGTDPIPSPPPRVWDAIVAEISADGGRPVRRRGGYHAPDRPSDGPTGDLPPFPRQVVPDRPTPHRVAADRPPTAPPARDDQTRLVRRVERRARRRTLVAAACACVLGLALGVGVTLGLGRTGGSEQGRPDVLASTTLSAVGATAGSARGTATLVRTDGHLELRVDARALPPVDGYYEAWMYVPGTQRMQSMGTVEPGTVTRIRVPAGLDADAWPGINISAERFDGDPGHSTKSVLDGTLHR